MEWSVRERERERERLYDAAATVRRMVTERRDKVVAVGECGLDYHYERLQQEQQQRAKEEEEAAAAAARKAMEAKKGGDEGGKGAGSGARGAVTVHDGYNFGITSAAGDASTSSTFATSSPHVHPSLR